MAGLSFRSGPTLVELSAHGVVTGVRYVEQPELSYLSEAGAVQVWAGGEPLEWSAPLLETDADEVEVVRTSADLRLVVRHTFAAGWGIRLALSNGGSAEQVLDDVLLSWRAPPTCPSWALAAGAAASVAILAPDGAGPVLGAVLRLGSVERAEPEGLHLGRIVLAPQTRYVVQWQVGFHDTPQAFGHGLHPEVPARLDLELGESAMIATTEDEALVLGLGLEADPARGGQELIAVTPGAYRVEVRSARGATAYELRVADLWSELLVAAAEVALKQPPSSAGVVRLAGLDSALVVQAALARGAFTDPYPAEDALDLFGVPLAEDDHLDVRGIGFFCGEHERSGDPEPLAIATRALLSTERPQPGLGLVSTQLCLALVVAGQSVTPVVDHLRALATRSSLAPGAGPVADQAALLELEVVTMARAGAVPGRGSAHRSASTAWQSGAVPARTAALGSWLGAGLRGHAVPPLPLDQLAHLAAVLALLPEPISAELRGRWGCTAHELARRGHTEVLTRLGRTSPGPAHGWLVLGSRPG